MFNIFEQPWLLLAVAIIILPVILMLRRIFPGKRHWWQLVLPAILAVAAFGLDRLIETDLEKISAVISTGVKAVEEENPDAIEAIIDDDYSDSYHHSKRTLMHHCRGTLSEPLVEKNIKRILSVEIPPPKTTAAAICSVRIVFDKQSYVYQSFKREMFVKVKIELQKGADERWLISRVEILELDRQPAKWQDIKQPFW